jgi:hypothetical protein
MGKNSTGCDGPQVKTAELASPTSREPALSEVEGAAVPTRDEPDFD